MKLKAKYKKADFESVPTQFAELYAQIGEDFVLSAIEGVKPEEEFVTQGTALTRERAFAKAQKDLVAKWSALGSFDEVQAKLDKIPELEAAATGVDEAAIAKRVEAKANGLLLPVQRKLDEATTKLKEYEGTVAGYVKKERDGSIIGDLNAACEKFKIVDKHRSDVRMYKDLFDTVDGKVVTKDGVGVVPGIGVETWLENLLPERPGWLPASHGSGANGSGNGTAAIAGNNPFTPGKENMTLMSAMIEKEPNRARDMIKAAGRAPSEFGL